MLRKVVILKGIPASGKSTYAKELVDNLGYKRVNKDDLRAMLDNSKWSKDNEKFVLQARDFLINQALLHGYNVVVDDTNLNPAHEVALRSMVEQFNANQNAHAIVETVFFDTPLELCLQRNRERNRKLRLAGIPVLVTDKVIYSMDRQLREQTFKHDKVIFPTDKLKAPVVYVPPAGKPKCIIVDIDGTLAHMTGRSPYEWHRVGEDRLDDVVGNLISHYYIQDPMQEEPEVNVIVLSGRDGGCRDVTEKWLQDKSVKYQHLYMRTAGDNRSDNIVKRELFDKYIKDNYQVLYVLDDRNQVVDMWRNDLGLKVLQVAEGDF